MHPSAEKLGYLLFQTHWRTQYRRILDIGSLDVNGSLRDCAPGSAEYVGIDLEEGKGVDRVLKDPYVYPFPNEHFDVIVSTSCFEHDPMFWLTFLEAVRVLKDQGILYINAPSNGPYHTHPWDNWRFYPDASLALEMWGQRNGLQVYAVESFIMSRNGPWNDYVMIFGKGGGSPVEENFLSDQLSDVRNVRKAGTKSVMKMSRSSPDLDDLQRMDDELKILRAAVSDARKAMLELETT